MTPGVMQILLIVLLVMILFGAGRIPLIMENLAKGVKSFKKGLNDEESIEKKAEPSKVEQSEKE